MNKMLEKIVVISSQFDNNNSPVDTYCIDKIVNQLKQTMVRRISFNFHINLSNYSIHIVTRIIDSFKSIIC